MKKNVIITCSNKKTGNFIINHWFKSLKDNVNLKNIDVVVIDYGLTDLQKKKLTDNKVILFKGTKDYHIVNKRFFDAGEYLKSNKYDQVLFVDGGDIIFQDDISDVFNKDKNIFRIVPIGIKVLFFEWVFTLFGNFSKTTQKKIWKVVKDKPVINAGVIFSPYNKAIELCQEIKKLIKNKHTFGPDQIIVNYFIYKSKYKFLDEKYNFQMSTIKEGFFVKKGIFYKKSGEKIVIVHNSGQIDFFRPIKNFGYGKKFNQLKYIIYNIKRTHYRLIEAYKEIFID